MTSWWGGAGLRLAVALIVAAGIVIVTGTAQAENGYADLKGGIVVGADIGFNLDPDQFAWSILAEYHVTENVAVGPLLQFGSGDDVFLFGATGMLKYKATLLETDRLKPYGQAGIGFLIADPTISGRSSETNVLFPIGGGFEYWAWDHTALGANFLVNISDDTYFSLLFGARYLF